MNEVPMLLELRAAVTVTAETPVDLYILKRPDLVEVNHLVAPSDHAMLAYLTGWVGGLGCLLSLASCVQQLLCLCFSVTRATHNPSHATQFRKDACRYYNIILTNLSAWLVTRNNAWRKRRRRLPLTRATKRQLHLAKGVQT